MFKIFSFVVFFLLNFKCFAEIEQTLSIIKPNAVEKNVTGQINSIIEKNNLKIVSQKMIQLSQKDAENFYFIHKDKSFFKDLSTFMTSSPVVVQVLEGENAISKYREIMGSTDPKKAKKDTIRYLYADSLQKNAVHGSDSPENAKIEIEFFFSKREIFSNIIK